LAFGAVADGQRAADAAFPGDEHDRLAAALGVEHWLIELIVELESLLGDEAAPSTR
jgi:hypothetical protein